MDKPSIERNFGLSDKKNSVTPEELLSSYNEKLQKGGKAPERYIPESKSVISKEELTDTLFKLVQELNSKIENFTEQELDTLCIPHPLLGKLTLREMLYNCIHHVQYHHTLAIKYLKNK